MLRQRIRYVGEVQFNMMNEDDVFMGNLEELVEIFEEWRDAPEGKGLRISRSGKEAVMFDFIEYYRAI